MTNIGTATSAATSGPEQDGINMDFEKLGQWLAKRAAEADAYDPQLKELKQQVSLAAERVTIAEGDAIAPALEAQEEANWSLIRYLERYR